MREITDYALKQIRDTFLFFSNTISISGKTHQKVQTSYVTDTAVFSTVRGSLEQVEQVVTVVLQNED